MQLLIQRGQCKTKILRLPIFSLWAKFEVAAEEDALITQYHVYDYILTEDKPGQLKRAAIIAGVIALLVAGSIRIPEVILPIFGIGTFLIYHQISEQIRVSDILQGRFFSCRSVVTLMNKEQEIAELGNCFRHLLEAMKNWGGKEIVELEPYVPPASRVIEKPHETT